jgi:hypothetical protein
MKKVTAIFFLFLFATSFTELGQLLKFPVLVQHYYSHQEKASISFYGFLQDHYTSHRDDGDNKEDMQLPFKMLISTPSLVVGVPSNRLEIIDPVPIIPGINFSRQEPFIAFGRLFSIFHPPRTS